MTPLAHAISQYATTNDNLTTRIALHRSARKAWGTGTPDDRGHCPDNREHPPFTLVCRDG
jgi:hypothetical protein